MDVFNKVLSSVSNTVQTTVSQLSGLLGNPITKEYEVGEAIGSAGPGSLFTYVAVELLTGSDDCRNIYVANRCSQSLF